MRIGGSFFMFGHEGEKPVVGQANGRSSRFILQMWILLYGPRDNHSFLVLREIIPTLRETAFYVLMWASWSGRYRSARHLFLLTNLYCMNIFVGRLNHSITPLHLVLLFGHFGEVERVNLIKDRETGEFRKFGFVQMKDAHDA
ncbi:MAG: hypothetical protein KBG86_06315, partial [Flavobacteriales bacterium]|nr:hypothetical protein [Flavobacteriales bacterium]